MPSQAPEQIKTVVGDNIRAAREAKRLTQRELAVRLDTDANSIARWERGAVMPGPTYLVQLATVLGREVGWFYGFYAVPETAKS